MKLDEWVDTSAASSVDPTPRGVRDEIVLDALAGNEKPRRHRLLILLIALLLLLALAQPALSRAAAKFAPPIAATGEFLMQATGRWQGYAIFPVDRSAVVLAAITDGAWPTPNRAWPDAHVLPIAPDLYTLGPDHTGALMYYAHPGPAGHSAWLASPGADGRWASGREQPEEVARAIDQLARQFEADTLARLARGEPGGPWSYNVRWGDDHIVLFHLMLLARGRHEAVAQQLEADPAAAHAIERLDLPALWADQADAARTLLDAVQAPDISVPAA